MGRFNPSVKELPPPEKRRHKQDPGWIGEGTYETTDGLHCKLDLDFEITEKKLK